MLSAVCPLCGKPNTYTEPLPSRTACSHCSAALRLERNGLAIVLYEIKAIDAVEEAVSEVMSEQDPIKRFAALSALERLHGMCLPIAYAYLMHGRLHERSAKRLDFSVIKCFLLNPYEQPGDFSTPQKKLFYEELFHGSDLKRCLRLTDAPEALVKRYLTELSEAYISLFLKGSSRYSGGIFGITLRQMPEKNLAVPTAAMIGRIRGDDFMSTDEKALLEACLYHAFARTMTTTEHLDARLKPVRGAGKGGNA